MRHRHGKAVRRGSGLPQGSNVPGRRAPASVPPRRGAVPTMAAAENTGADAKPSRERAGKALTSVTAGRDAHTPEMLRSYHFFRRIVLFSRLYSANPGGDIFRRARPEV